MRLPFTRYPVLVVSFILVLAVSAAPARDAVSTLSITTATGKHVFHVEVAQSESEREVGLMNRRSLASDHGMIFVFPKSQRVAFWMKNTLISLDMIFVRQDGVIAGIKADATPLSEDIIPSPEPVRFVIELNGGEAAEIAARRGDKVESAVISDATAK